MGASRPFRGVFIVKIIGILICSLLALASFDAAQAAPASIKRQQCQNFFDGQYKGARRPKAFALSADGMRCGAAWGHLSKQVSQKEALRYCTSEAKKHGGGKCKVIDIQ
ncbi:hypothetical protein [Stappia sp.]|uniref:hypothetical protein n=1 Tax=Stappia sp. TaxID=1870903 RepID=UPI003A99E099